MEPDREAKGRCAFEQSRLIAAYMVGDAELGFIFYVFKE